MIDQNGTLYRISSVGVELDGFTGDGSTLTDALRDFFERICDEDIDTLRYHCPLEVSKYTYPTARTYEWKLEMPLFEATRLLREIGHD